MISQDLYAWIFALLIAAQLYCAYRAFKSEKPIGTYVGQVNIAIMVPIIANIVIIESTNAIFASFGYYLSYIGMTLVLLTMTYFTTEYCRGVDPVKKHRKPYIMYIIGLADITQLIIGIFSQHVFTISATMLEGRVYFRDNALIGLSIHRIIDYTMYVCILLIYIVCAKKTSKLYREKFLVIMVTMLLAGIMQGIFIYSKTPIDRSIVVHGLFGIVVYYLSIRHRPLKLLDTLLSNVASNMNDAVFVFDVAGRCVWANEQGYDMFGKHKDTDPSCFRQELISMFGDLSDKGEDWTDDVRVQSNQRYYVLEKKSVRSGAMIEGFFIIVHDSTERHNAIEQEIYDSMHDSLTGLYNITYLYAAIKDAVKSVNEECCVIYMDVRNFKITNDIFGMRFGDAALKKIAAWIDDTFKDDAEVLYGRLMGDTFGIFMPTRKFNEKVFVDGLSDFEVEHLGKTHKVIVHAGVYTIRDPKVDVSGMFDRAHLALLTISSNYKTCVKEYDESLRLALLEEQLLISSLPAALLENQIHPYLQPITDIHGKVVGAESLARWDHPELGYLAPAKFIPIFEKNGSIVEVDRHIWEESCKILHRWKDIYPDLFLSINISPKDFYFTDVVSDIEHFVKKYDIDARKLRIEITETALMTNAEDRFKIFDRLRSSGFIVEMDDFGSGYSSLNMLKDMPVDVLKIDMNFLAGENDAKSAIIMKNVIGLSNELDIIALTEGVETYEQFENLIKMGCSLFQGYYFAKPMDLPEFEKFVKNRNLFNG